MIIQLEGVDCTGKTTLYNALTTKLQKLASLKQLTIVKDAESLVTTNPRKPNRISCENLWSTLFKWARQRNHIYIMDRGPISDNVYRCFDDIEPVMDLRLCAMMYQCSGIIVIHCDSPRGREIIKERGDDNPIALANWDKIHKTYRIMMPLFNPFIYDFDKVDMNKFVDNIISKLLKERRALK